MMLLTSDERRATRSAKRRIGLLGGSFNPAHEGHLHISLEALRRLKLDEVWWLVSPQNPLKPKAGMAAYSVRLAHARRVANHPGIFVSDVERKIGSAFTYDTLKYLTRRYPRVQFVWLMGADNLKQFHRWHKWWGIVRMMPVAVFDRAPFSHNALHSHVALRLARWRRRGHKILRLSGCLAPAFAYIFMRRHPESATRLRKTLGKSVFLGHTEGVV